MSTLITLDMRISLGHALGCFWHSLPAFLGFLPLCTHCRVENTVGRSKTTCKDYRLLIGSFRLSVTGEVLAAATHPKMRVDLHHLVQCAARRIYFVQDPGTYSR
jgi:hypothetical protein